jgi:hypothetical protein
VILFRSRRKASRCWSPEIGDSAQSPTTAPFLDALSCAESTDETIPLPRHGLDIARIVGIIIESLPELLNGSIQAVLEFDEGAIGPETSLQLVPGDYLPRPLQKCNQNPERKVLQLDTCAVPPELVRRRIRLELPEPVRR